MLRRMVIIAGVAGLLALSVACSGDENKPITGTEEPKSTMQSTREAVLSSLPATPLPGPTVIPTPTPDYDAIESRQEYERDLQKGLHRIDLEMGREHVCHDNIAWNDFAGAYATHLRERGEEYPSWEDFTVPVGGLTAVTDYVRAGCFVIMYPEHETVVRELIGSDNYDEIVRRLEATGKLTEMRQFAMQY